MKDVFKYNCPLISDKNLTVHCNTHTHIHKHTPVVGGNMYLPVPGSGIDV